MSTEKKLVVRIFQEAMEDGITGEAAKAAYYFFLSFFPAILALFAFTGILGGDETFRWIMGQLRGALPGSAADFLQDFVREITGDSRPGMLSFGIIATLWSSSNVFAILTEGLNRMYDLEEGRPWWQKRLYAMASLTVGMVCLSVGSVVLLAGPDVVQLVGVPEAIFQVIRWPLAFAMLWAMMWLVYYLLPNRDQSGTGRQVAIGAAVGTVLWVAVTGLFRLYVANFGSYSESYGFVGAIMVLLLWLYLTALAILFGGEVAATLEQHQDPEKWDRERGDAPEAEDEEESEEAAEEGTEEADRGSESGGVGAQARRRPSGDEPALVEKALGVSPPQGRGEDGG